MHDLPREIPGEATFPPGVAERLHKSDAEARRIIGEFMAWLDTRPHRELYVQVFAPMRVTAPVVGEDGVRYATVEPYGVTTLTLTGPICLFSSQPRPTPTGPSFP